MAAPPKNVVLITGANGGIGFETAAAVAAASSHNHVILCSRSSDKGIAAVLAIEARSPDGTLSSLQLDVTDSKSIAAAVGKVKSDFGHLNVLVNNAGIVSFNPDPLLAFREVFETNTFAPAMVTEAFLPLLKEAGSARIVNISSGLGSITERLDPNDPYKMVPATSYRMTKAALNMLTACHHAEYKDSGIKVLAVDPGYVISNLTGEEGRKQRLERGAMAPEVPAQFVLSVIDGRNDENAGKMVRNGGVVAP